jgi:hypothetical protein
MEDEAPAAMTVEVVQDTDCALAVGACATQVQMP